MKCEHKRYWPNPYAARAAGRALGQTAYACPHCDGWHLTTQPQDVRDGQEDQSRQRSQEALQMGKSGTKLTLRVLQVNAATATETTKTDKEGAVTGIERQIYEDVRLAVTGVETGAQEGGGRLVSGELVLSLPEGEAKVGQVFEAALNEKNVDDDDLPTPGGDQGNTLRQSPDEAERGRKPDGTLGDEKKVEKAKKDGGTGGSSSSRSARRSSGSRSRSNAPRGASSGKVPGPQETDQRAGSSNNPST